MQDGKGADKEINSAITTSENDANNVGRCLIQQYVLEDGNKTAGLKSGFLR